MFDQASECLNDHFKAGGKIQLSRNIVEQDGMLVKRFKQKLSSKEMCTRCTLFNLDFITWHTDIKDDLSDPDHIIHIQRTFARDSLMVDECAVGTVQIDN